MLLKEKLAEALEKKNNDINSFVWKGKKQLVNGKYVQSEKKLIDCTEQELKEHYAYCDSMLYNNSEDHPGRYVLIERLKDQRARCNTELFLRWLEDKNSLPRFKFLEALRGFLDVNKEIVDPKQFPIGEIINGDCPNEFVDIPASLVLDGCIDKLGRLNKRPITLSFIYKQGLWFTAQESKDLTEKDENGNLKDRLEVVKDRLRLPTINVNLYTNPTGLSYTQFRALINLKNKKYSELTTDQLKILRDRVLFTLEDEAKRHAKQWEVFKQNIRKICEIKGYTI